MPSLNGGDSVSCRVLYYNFDNAWWTCIGGGRTLSEKGHGSITVKSGRAFDFDGYFFTVDGSWKFSVGGFCGQPLGTLLIQYGDQTFPSINFTP